MLYETYLKEYYDFEDDNSVYLVSFEGDKNSINRLREWAKKINGDKPTTYDATDEAVHDDMVEHPAHYCTGNIEVIDFIEDQDLGYHLGNACKYICRAGKKHEAGMSDNEKTIEDLKKAIWYINRKIETL